MSAPAAIGCAFAAVVLGIPVVAVGAGLEARHRVAGAADAAALAAAYAAAGWIPSEPCALAAEVTSSMSVVLTSCEAAGGEARVEVRAAAPLGGVRARARAAPERASGGEVGANGWAWPSGVRGVTQDFHDGYAIDLAVAADGALYAPYDGVVVSSGSDGGGIPAVCAANPGWWRGPNHGVVMRHEFKGRVMFSSHNHIAPGSGAKPGTVVRAGQRVATAGMSGCTSGPHSHFTLSTRPSSVKPDLNPYEYLGA